MTGPVHVLDEMILANANTEALIHPRCKELLKDLEQVRWISAGTGLGVPSSRETVVTLPPGSAT
jgi:hypothetical protein